MWRVKQINVTKMSGASSVISRWMDFRIRLTLNPLGIWTKGWHKNAAACFVSCDWTKKCCNLLISKTKMQHWGYKRALQTPKLRESNFGILFDSVLCHARPRQKLLLSRVFDREKKKIHRVALVKTTASSMRLYTPFTHPAYKLTFLNWKLSFSHAAQKCVYFICFSNFRYISFHMQFRGQITMYIVRGTIGRWFVGCLHQFLKNTAPDTTTHNICISHILASQWQHAFNNNVWKIVIQIHKIPLFEIHNKKFAESYIFTAQAFAQLLCQPRLVGIRICVTHTNTIFIYFLFLFLSIIFILQNVSLVMNSHTLYLQCKVK